MIGDSMQFGLFPQIECFTIKGIRFTIDPLFPFVILILFWQYIVAGAFAVAFAGLLSFAFLILWHELGHALMAKLCKVEVYSVNLNWFGGSCVYHKTDNENKRVLIASGGVLAQALVVLMAITFVLFLPISTPIMAIVLHTLIKTNLILIGLNLLPFPPFDGHKIFSYFKKKFLELVSKHKS